MGGFTIDPAELASSYGGKAPAKPSQPAVSQDQKGKDSEALTILRNQRAKVVGEIDADKALLASTTDANSNCITC